MGKEWTILFDDLGGLQPVGDALRISEEETERFLEQKELSGNKDFKDFIRLCGGKALTESVVCSGFDRVPSFPGGEIPLSVIFGFMEGPFGIIEIDELVEDNIPAGFFPFAMGDPTGDYWVYHMESGGIYFWEHDEPGGENIHKAASSIKVFIRNCRIRDESPSPEDSEHRIVDFWISDDL